MENQINITEAKKNLQDMLDGIENDNEEGFGGMAEIVSGPTFEHGQLVATIKYTGDDEVIKVVYDPSQKDYNGGQWIF